MADRAAIKKGDRLDFVTQGRVRRRRCTDVLVLLLFLCFVGIYIGTAVSGFSGDTSYERLITGRDWQGNLCGVTNELTHASVQMEDYPKMALTFNVREYLDYVFSDMTVLSTVTPYYPGESFHPARSVDTSVWTQNTVKHVQHYNRVVNKILTGYYAPTYMNYTYFTPVCVTECEYATANATLTRTFTYTATALNYVKWNYQVTNYFNNWATLYPTENYFVYEALPFSVCPYDPEYCIPVGKSVQEIMSRFCVPRIIDDNDDVYLLPVWGYIQDFGFWSAFGDLGRAWAVLLVTIGVAIISAIIFVVAAPLTGPGFLWLSGFATFAVMGASGATALLFSALCINESLSELSTRIGETGWDMSTSCKYGYAVPHPEMRGALRIFSYLIMSVCLIYGIIMLFLCKRIRLGLVLHKVAWQFLARNLKAFFFVIVLAGICGGFMALWLFVATNTVSQIPSSELATTSKSVAAVTAIISTSIKEKTEAAIAEMAKICPEESIYKLSVDETNWPYTKTYYACKPNRYHFDWRICYQIWFLLYVCEIFVTLAKSVIAGAFGTWYCQEDKARSAMNGISFALWNSLFKNFGSVLLGSLISLFTNGYKDLFGWFKRLGRDKNKNSTLWIVLGPIMCFATYVDRLIYQAGDNAIAQMIMTGISYTQAGNSAHRLITRNSGKATALTGLSGWVNTFGRFFVTTMASGASWLMYWLIYEGKWTSPILPIVGFIVTGYYIGGIVLSLITMIVPAMMQCYLVDAEVNADEGGAKNMPSELATLMQRMGAGPSTNTNNNNTNNNEAN